MTNVSPIQVHLGHKFIDPRGRPQSRPVVITIFTQSVRLFVRPKTSKSSDNHVRPGLWAGRVDHWWLLPVLFEFVFDLKWKNNSSKKEIFCFSCSVHVFSCLWHIFATSSSPWQTNNGWKKLQNAKKRNFPRKSNLIVLLLLLANPFFKF